ncbi:MULTISPECIES: pitrilysin family protein [unclassified Clostridium]|uniref:M16 family metallopeptidase n=1 Tax=Clostridium TaxID=1485 RepID=UPI001C8BA369|nr:MULTISPECIES: pitrilysin family protein [unclassified Clostridium]MBX9136825.1 insulinase family protein [Clostridium sp. K12(2020)]MBX9143635.1 insulinase family protein [Clostridium sp. K13]MDU2289605.1 pitrilysin family protein [Clostridium celatum]
MVKINFDVKKHKLDNGLEVITINKDTQISSINIGVKVGALNETLSEKGISHYIEHMLFKGTENRTFQKLNDDLEALGGEYNAYTDYSQTVYSISCLEDELKNAIELLSDMLISSKFPKEEVEKERGVILAEIRSSKDSVEDFSFKKINEVAFKKSALRYDVAGLDENVKKFTRDELCEYYKRYYRPNNALITMVSSLSHEEAIKEISEQFSKWEQSEVVKVEVEDEKNRDIKKVTTKENIELCTIIYLFTFYDLDKKYELPLRILNHRLGESANSLLFREVRENRGLAYDIYSHLDITQNVKTLYVYTAVDEEDIDDAANAIEEIFKNIKFRKIIIGENDLNIMKKVHKTAVISTLEDSVELCSYILSQSLEGEDIFEFLKDMENLNTITADEIYEVANKVLNKPTIHILKSS